MDDCKKCLTYETPDNADTCRQCKAGKRREREGCITCLAGAIIALAMLTTTIYLIIKVL